MSESDTLLSVLREVRQILSAVNHYSSVQINSANLLNRIRHFVQRYFRELRPELVVGLVATEILDQQMQDLMRMANAYTSTAVYKKIFTKIESNLGEAEVSREYLNSQRLSGGTQVIAVRNTSQQDGVILNMLEQVVPGAAMSYKQALADLQENRASYRGTATELREVLREVLDYLAPDVDVEAIPGFNFEEGKKQPTMKQKVHHILKIRETPDTAMGAPRMAAQIVDESVPRLVRAVYERGSLSAHSHREGRPEILQIKMYLDSVLCDLLEIHRT